MDFDSSLQEKRLTHPKMEIHSQRVESTLEKRILCMICVSKKYTQEISPLFDLAYFQNTYIRKTVEWAFDYFEKYGEPSNKHIFQVFEFERQTMQEETATLIEQILTQVEGFINSNYESTLNIDFLVDETLLYFKRRELEITAGNIQVLLGQNDIEGAEDQVTKYKRVARITSGWENPFEHSKVIEVFERKDNVFYQFPGVLGQYMGPIEKEWFIAIEGGYKRGKTHFLDDFAIIGVMQHIPTTVISLEMTKIQQRDRFYRRIQSPAPPNGRGDNEDYSYIEYPCFDCKKNQLDVCSLMTRTNQTGLIEEKDDPLPPFDPNSDYKPCIVCKNQKDSEYEFATYYRREKRPEYNVYNTSHNMESFDSLFGKYLRIKSYPRFSANIADIKRDLHTLRYTEDFTPGLIVIDYADILKPERTGAQGVSKEDETWMALGALAQEHHAIVATATQITKDGLEAHTLSEQHTARWSGKLGHVDVLLTMNQIPAERERGVMRIGIKEHRHASTRINKQCHILQNYDSGQFYLDGYF